MATGRTFGESIGGVSKMDRYDWSSGIRNHTIDSRFDTEFKMRDKWRKATRLKLRWREVVSGPTAVLMYPSSLVSKNLRTARTSSGMARVRYSTGSVGISPTPSKSSALRIFAACPESAMGCRIQGFSDGFRDGEGSIRHLVLHSLEPIFQELLIGGKDRT